MFFVDILAIFWYRGGIVAVSWRCRGGILMYFGGILVIF